MLKLKGSNHPFDVASATPGAQLATFLSGPKKNPLKVNPGGAVQGMNPPTVTDFKPVKAPGAMPIAQRTTAINTANTAYQSGSGSALDKTRAQNFTNYRDSVASAKAAGQPKPPKPTGGFGAKDPGTTPIRDVRQTAGLPVKQVANPGTVAKPA